MGENLCGGRDERSYPYGRICRDLAGTCPGQTAVFAGCNHELNSCFGLILVSVAVYRKDEGVGICPAVILIKELREALNVEVQSIGGLHNAYAQVPPNRKPAFPDWKSF